MKFDRLTFMILYDKQKGICGYCKCVLVKEKSRPHIDHIIPKTKGGKDEIINYMLTCDWCNCVKRNKSREDFEKYIKPYLEGKTSKKGLCEYNIYLKLQEKYGKSTT